MLQHNEKHSSQGVMLKHNLQCPVNSDRSVHKCAADACFVDVANKNCTTPPSSRGFFSRVSFHRRCSHQY